MNSRPISSSGQNDQGGSHSKDLPTPGPPRLIATFARIRIYCTALKSEFIAEIWNPTWRIWPQVVYYLIAWQQNWAIYSCDQGTPYLYILIHPVPLNLVVVRVLAHTLQFVPLDFMPWRILQLCLHPCDAFQVMFQGVGISLMKFNLKYFGA